MKLNQDNPTRQGLVVVGATRSCGKTVVTAGLAAALGAEGFRVQAYKPVAFCEDHDQAYLNRITQQFLTAQTFTTPCAWDWDTMVFNKLQEQMRQLEYPFLFDTPAMLSTPWRVDGHRVSDALTLAQDLGVPVILVIAAGPDFLAQARLSLAYLQARHIATLGFIGVLTQSAVNVSITPQDTMLLAQQFNVPFLGELPHSPSISVAGLQQGNLVRLTQENIDLLPIQLGMGLTVMSTPL